MARMTATDAALLRLLQTLRDRGYEFVTPTPATHARVLARSDRRQARDLQDVLGWSLPFAPDTIDAEILALLEAGEAVEAKDGGLLHATLRVSSLHDRLFLHSAYPTEAEDAVFLGPDSYRFADLIQAELERDPPRRCDRIVDIGTGAGVGAIVAAAHCPGAAVTMTDVNPKALRLARINARAAGFEIEAVQADMLTDVAAGVDVALANPPYIIDPSARAYRDGGDMLGGRVSYDMARAACERLAPGGRMILYTGSAIVRGQDALRDALEGMAAEQGVRLRYREIDPDVFGEELEEPAYAQVDRIALVAAVCARD